MNKWITYQLQDDFWAILLSLPITNYSHQVKLLTSKLDSWNNFCLCHRYFNYHLLQLLKGYLLCCSHSTRFSLSTEQCPSRGNGKTVLAIGISFPEAWMKGTGWYKAHCWACAMHILWMRLLSGTGLGWFAPVGYPNSMSGCQECHIKPRDRSPVKQKYRCIMVMFYSYSFLSSYACFGLDKPWETV